MSEHIVAIIFTGPLHRHAWCVCRWAGPVRYHTSAARMDGIRHEMEHKS